MVRFNPTGMFLGFVADVIEFRKSNLYDGNILAFEFTITKLEEKASERDLEESLPCTWGWPEVEDQMGKNENLFILFLEKSINASSKFEIKRIGVLTGWLIQLGMQYTDNEVFFIRILFTLLERNVGITLPPMVVKYLDTTRENFFLGYLNGVVLDQILTKNR